MLRTLSLILLVFFFVCPSPLEARFKKPLKATFKKPLQLFRPFNIAHRGSCGEIPEETAEAYKRAIVEGADFIEADITATKDGELICFHDLTLDATTDVADHSRFADRVSTYVVGGKNVTGYFVVDFTLDELKVLKMKQRFDFRDQSHNGKYNILTFHEYIDIAQKAKRTVGIYPEIKDPMFINEHVQWPMGRRFEDVFVAILKERGYNAPYKSLAWLIKPIFIQSFALSSLSHIHSLISAPKVLLLDTAPTVDTDETFDELTSPERLDGLMDWIDGIGPWKDSLVPASNDSHLLYPTTLVRDAHERGLLVHPYTFRNENQFLHFDFHQDPYKEYDYWVNTIGVDGLFTDFPGSLASYMTYRKPFRV